MLTWGLNYAQMLQCDENEDQVPRLLNLTMIIVGAVFLDLTYAKFTQQSQDSAQRLLRFLRAPILM